METNIKASTDADLVFDLLIRAAYDEHGYYVPTSDTLALQQDWDYRYSTGQDTPR